MGKKWGTVIKNSDTYVTFSHSDTNGVFTFTDRKYDTTATYKVEFLNAWKNKVEPGIHNITAVQTLPDVAIKLTPTAMEMPFGCGEVMYLPYRTRTPYAITDLPKVIQQKIKHYFLERVGTAFYSKLLLNGGQILNLERFYSFNPAAKANKWVPPAYDLCFMVWDSLSHKSAYNFQLELDKNGKLVKTPPLPDILHYPKKAHIMSKEEAIAIGKQHNLYKPYSQMNLYNYPKAGSLVWELESHEPGEGEKVSTHVLIDAHDGKIVDTLTSKISVM